jgi:hypothetical protein
LTQQDAIILCLKIGLIAGFASIAFWVAVYSRLTRGGAWRNTIGLSLIIEALLIAGLFVPQVLSLFFQLNRLDSRIVAWTDVTLIGLVSPVMAWRTVAFLRMGPSPERKHREAGRTETQPMAEAPQREEEPR